MARISTEQKDDIKQRFRVLPPTLAVTECYRRLIAATGYKIEMRTFQRWVRTEKWQRDLSEEVKRETAAKMMQAQIIKGAEILGLDPKTLDGDETARVDAAANVAATVLIAHQTNIGDLREIFTHAASDLKDQSLNKRVALLNKKTGEMELCAPSVAYVTDQLRKLTVSLKDLIDLERITYGIDSGESGESSDDILLALAREAMDND